MELPVEARNQIESSFFIDPTPGPRGPITVSRSFLESLKGIDSRLELRWLPRLNRYAVFLRFPFSNALWRTAVHTIQHPDGSFRHPQECDLSAIRKAKWYFETTGMDGKIQEMDKQLASQHKYASDAREQRLLEMTRDLARKHDITLQDLGADRHHLRPRKFTNKTSTCFHKETSHGSD